MKEKFSELAEKIDDAMIVAENEQRLKRPRRRAKGPWLMFLFIVIVSAGVIAFLLSAKGIGSWAGERVGKASGSFEGIMEKLPQGLEDGKKQGLSAEDTKVDVATQIEEIGKLEVLKASVLVDNYHEIADDYRAIYIYKADAVFTVDLENAVVEKKEDQLSICLQTPSVDFRFNEEETEKIAEWQRHFYSGKTKDGYEAYINSRKQIAKKAPTEIENDDTLMEIAKEAAIKQVGILAQSVSGETKIEIIFEDKGNKDAKESEEK